VGEQTISRRDTESVTGGDIAASAEAKQTIPASHRGTHGVTSGDNALFAPEKGRAAASR
jgi:hypothetical protein